MGSAAQIGGVANFGKPADLTAVPFSSSDPMWRASDRAPPPDSPQGKREGVPCMVNPSTLNIRCRSSKGAKVRRSTRGFRMSIIKHACSHVTSPLQEFWSYWGVVTRCPHDWYKSNNPTFQIRTLFVASGWIVVSTRTPNLMEMYHAPSLSA